MKNEKPPNILVLMTDQQRFDSLGCYGFSAANTPSRASMLTGKHTPGHAVYRLLDILPAQDVLIPRRLQDVGYTTALFGKLHVSGRVYEAHNRHPNDGFEVYAW